SVATRRTGGSAIGAGRGGRLLVQALTQLLHTRRQRLSGPSDAVDVTAGEGVLEGLQVPFDPILLGAREGRRLILQHLFGLVDQAVGLVANLRLLTATAVLLGVRLGVPDHPVN